jgi:hypothetical protein
MISLKRTIFLLTFFSIAMGFMESAVVIYLRELYYPGGFKFPLVPIPPGIALTEFLREAATLIMLTIIGIIAGKNTAQRFSFFLFCFAAWDLFYYVFLKLFLNWPESFFTPDILFLIPFRWVGPVIAPCIASLTMIGLMLMVIYYQNRKVVTHIRRNEWLLLVTGTLVMIASFTQDYFAYIFNKQRPAWNPASGNKLFQEFLDYVPQSFNWLLFFSGEALLLAAILVMLKRFNEKYRETVIS